MNIDNYYKEVISKFTNEDALVDFLNNSDMLKKFDDNQREYFITKWLTDNGWVEIDTEEQE